MRMESDMRVVYPELQRMARDLSEILGKDPEAVRKLILRNAQFLLKNIPPEELLSIFDDYERFD